jgi:hypothetical protein
MQRKPNLTRKQIENRKRTIQLVDTQDELDLFCYTKCTNTSPDIDKRCRGVVFHKDNLVFEGFPFTPELSETEISKAFENTKLMDCHFYDAHEGTLLNVFYARDKWFIATHRRLDAFKSNWASKTSFGDSFVNALDHLLDTDESFMARLDNSTGENIIQRFLNSLDKNIQYSFIVQSNDENRVVCLNIKEPTVYHVGSFKKGVWTNDVNCGVPYPKSYTFNQVENISKHVESVDITKTQGLFVVYPRGFMKLVSDKYTSQFALRGNRSSLKYRYLEVRMDPVLRPAFMELYSEYNDLFERYDNILMDIGKYIHSSYIARFVRKEVVKVPEEEFRVMRKCHAFHMSDRDYNRVSYNVVMDILDEQSPTRLNKMIRRYLHEIRVREIEQQQFEEEEEQRHQQSAISASF